MTTGQANKEIEEPMGLLSRRQMIATAATVAGIVAVGEDTPTQAEEPAPLKSVDVIIVGGGLSGLSAARTLAAQHRSVLVLEANDRVGGRTWTEKVAGGGWVDMGGQWVGPTQDRILALAKAVGVETFPTFTDGKTVLVFQGKRIEYAGDFAAAPIPADDLKDFAAAIEKINAFAKQVPVDEPGSAAKADEWDSQTLATWVRDNMASSGARFMMRVFALGDFAAEPRDISFLHFLFYVHAAGGFEHLHTSALAARLVGGAQEVSRRVAKELGDRVRLEMPVRKIERNADGVVVHTDSARLKAQRVIVAIPPTLAARIIYEPPLTGSRDQFMQRDFMGATIKCHAVYPTPFWRKKGLNGMAVSDTAVSFVADNSMPDGKLGILGGFFEGQDARDWADRPPEEIRKRVLADFEKFFGPEAREPKEFFQSSWPTKSWSRGCFAGVLPPGTWTGYPKVVRTPIDRIHWAGTETATRWYAYMDGAVSSGERAAEEVLKELGKK